ncbi:MAG: proline racemase family protein [Candidatus Aminicenantes bacterium]|jgi:trans-L-3-hydroxyproline dehydratase
MLDDWKPPDGWPEITTIDAHSAGEPLRIVTSGLGRIPGETILEKRRYAQENLDNLRTGLMWEPRGHADMYGALLTEPVTPDGDLGVLFMHNEGFSTMCGHGVIALVKVVLDTGMIEKEGDNPVVKMDTPAGRVIATAHRAGGKIKEVSFHNVPSFVFKSNQVVEVPGIGVVQYDVAFGGAFYAVCGARELKLGLEEKNFHQLIDMGKRIKQTVMDDLEIKHPFEEDLGFLYGVIFVGEAQDPTHHSRNACVFAEGELDRSPTGTGVSARAAIHFSRGELFPGHPIVVESILGTSFRVRIANVVDFDIYRAVIPEVIGTASIIGQSRFCFDPEDPLREGFIFR